LTGVLVAAGIAGLLTIPNANANVITAGGPTLPPDQFDTITGNVLASITAPFTGITINGTYTTKVIQDTSRGGMLDFIIQVTNGALSNVLEGITNSFYDGFTVDAGFLKVGSTAGGLTTLAGNATPATVNESLSTTVSFNFEATPVPIGGTSAVLVIMTNAFNFASGLIGINDGSTATVTGFQPTAVPGPLAGAGLPGLIMACGGLIALARRRRQAATV